VGCLVLASARTSSAASLGPLAARSLGAWSVTGGTGAPIVSGWDSFTRPNGTNLNGQASGGGGPAWQVITGVWTTSANAAKSSNTADAAIVVDCGSTNLTTTAALTLPAGTAAFSAGLTLKATGAWLLVVNYSSANSGRLDIATVYGGTTTVLASVTGVGRTSPATLSATYADGTVTVRLNGVPRLTTTLSWGNALLAGFSTRSGLYADADAVTLFDDFRCER
jgi:hypothetical protein